MGAKRMDWISTDQTGDLRWRCVARLLLGLVVLAGAVGVAVPAGLGWDFANFYDAGRKVACGEAAQLYVADVPVCGRAAQGTMEFLSTPLCALLLVPLGWMSPEWALAAFKLEGTAAMLGGLWLLLQVARRWGGAGERFAALYWGLVLLWQPFWTVYRVGGQTMPTVFLLLVAALELFGRGRVRTAAACLVGAVVLKPGMSGVLAFLLGFAGWRFGLAALAWGAGAGVASVSLLGWEAHAAFLKYGLQERHVSWVYNSAVTVAVENLRLLWEPGVNTAVRIPEGLGLAIWVVRAVVAAIVVWAAWQARDFEKRYLLALLFGLTVSPVVWEHYLQLVFIPVIWLMAQEAEFGWWWRASLWTVVACAAGQNIVLVKWLAEHLQIGGVVGLISVGLWKSAPLWGTVGLLACKREAVRR